MVTKEVMDKVQQGNIDKDDLRLLEVINDLVDVPEQESPDKVVHPGDDLVPPIIRTPTTSAGYVNLRRNSDGKLVPVNRNQLLQRLKQKLEDGRPAWLPPSQPWKGHVIKSQGKCLLHPDDPDRGEWDELGLPVCMKSNMPKQSIRRHMALKHKMAWAAIQQYRTEKREDARDAHQETLSRAVTQTVKELAKSRARGK